MDDELDGYYEAREAYLERLDADFSPAELDEEHLARVEGWEDYDDF